MESHAVPVDVQDFLSHIAAAGETFGYLTTLEQRVWSLERDLAPGTLDELRDFRGRTRSELVALGHHFGRVHASCPSDLRSYFDWLLCHSHDAVADPPCTALQDPFKRIRECRSISNLFRKLAENPVEQLKSPPKQYGDFLIKRIETFNARRMEWPTQGESNGRFLPYTEQCPAYYSLPIPDPALERDAAKMMADWEASQIELSMTTAQDRPNEEPRSVDGSLSTSQKFAHSDDFRSVRWDGVLFSFTEKQALVVEVAWRNWKQGTPDVADDTLLAAADPQCPPDRLNVLFRSHPAWNVMIIKGGSKGTHRIADV